MPLPVSLLDANILLALAWPNHAHHEAAHQWFAANRASGWATCPHTEMAFLRLSMQPAVVKAAITFTDALRALTSSLAAPEHEFWALDCAFPEIRAELRERIISHLHLADALLLDLAIRRRGRFVTFDRRIMNLLPPESPHRAALEILAIE